MRVYMIQRHEDLQDDPPYLSLIKSLSPFLWAQESLF